MSNKEYFHAIEVIQDNCCGCTQCVRICPTEAIRLVNEELKIDGNKCIDCGKCIEACKYDALRPISDSLELIKNFKYKIAIVPFSFAGQFSKELNYSQAKRALLKLGFDEVVDTAIVSQFMTQMIQDQIRKNQKKRPFLSNNCPTVVRLIQMRFPSLIPNIIPLEAPVSVLTKYYRDKISNSHNLKNEEIGVFSIVPCVAQVTAVHQPEGAYKRIENGAFSVQEIYNEIMSIAHEIEELPSDNNKISKGHTNAMSGLESDEVAADDISVISVSGIHNVIDILLKIENHQIEPFDYAVLKSCTRGCVGGLLNAENPFVAASRIKRMMSEEYDNALDPVRFNDLYENEFFGIGKVEPRSIMELDTNIFEAIKKMKQIQLIEESLPGLDCCACGCPTCNALAEEIVQGKRTIDDCLVLFKKGNKTIK